MDQSTPEHLQLNGMCGSVLLWSVILIDPGFEGAGPDWIFGAQADCERGCLFPGERVKIEDCLRGGKAELLQPSGRGSQRFVLQRLQVFAEQVEAGWDAEIDHDHVGGLFKIVLYGNLLGCN